MKTSRAQGAAFASPPRFSRESSVTNTVLPTLQALLIADNVYQDKRTGKFIIAGVFDTILRPPQGEDGLKARSDAPDGLADQAEVAREPQSREMPRAMGAPTAYLNLRGIRGQLKLRVRFVRLADSEILFEGEVAINHPDPLSSVEAQLELPNLPVAELGSYSFDVSMDDETLLGGYRLTVREENSKS